MWLAITYWIDSCLYDPPILTVIAILLKPKPAAVFDFLLKRELRPLCMKFYSRASLLYLKYLHMKIRLQKGRRVNQDGLETWRL